MSTGQDEMLEHMKKCGVEGILIPINTRIKEFKCENCIAYIRYTKETKETHCPLCKQVYNINHLEIITKK